MPFLRRIRRRGARLCIRPAVHGSHKALRTAYRPGPARSPESRRTSQRSRFPVGIAGPFYGVHRLRLRFSRKTGKLTRKDICSARTDTDWAARDFAVLTVQPTRSAHLSSMNTPNDPTPHGNDSKRYGEQTRRALENFPLSGRPLPPAFIHALGLIKACAARVNGQLGRLPPAIAEAIASASDEVADGLHDDQFPVDVFQTGSGTSSNMNANEVIASLAAERAGCPVHPNDHVNAGQSSNDVIPTAIHLSAASELQRLKQALKDLAGTIDRRAAEFPDLVKTGRTHLMDAVPIRLAQELLRLERPARLRPLAPDGYGEPVVAAGPGGHRGGDRPQCSPGAWGTLRRRARAPHRSALPRGGQSLRAHRQPGHGRGAAADS